MGFLGLGSTPEALRTANPRRVHRTLRFHRSKLYEPAGAQKPFGALWTLSAGSKDPCIPDPCDVSQHAACYESPTDVGRTTWPQHGLFAI